MLTRALLLAASAVAATVAVPRAHALAPLAMDAVMDQSLSEAAATPSPYSTLAPSSFAPLPDETYVPTAYVANGRARLQCVPFARQEAGVEIYGDANTWWAQAAGRYARTARPAERAVIVLHGYASANRGHVGVVKEVVSGRLIVIDHANWLNGGEITRSVPVRDVSPNNDWGQVQVWNVPGRHWGGRVYRVEGFILSANEHAQAASATAGG